MLDSDRLQGVTCHFTTCSDVTLRPMALTSASLRPLKTGAAPDACPTARAVLGMRLQSTAANQPLTTESLANLSLFLQGQQQATFPLYELLVRDALAIHVHSERGTSQWLFNAPLFAGGGFGVDEDLFDWSARTSPGMRRACEFFAFPEKFLFVNLAAASRLDPEEFGPTVDIAVYLRRSSQPLEDHCSARTMQLHCTPAVNLFRKRTEPGFADTRHGGVQRRSRCEDRRASRSLFHRSGHSSFGRGRAQTAGNVRTRALCARPHRRAGLDRGTSPAE